MIVSQDRMKELRAKPSSARAHEVRALLELIEGLQRSMQDISREKRSTSWDDLLLLIEHLQDQARRFVSRPSMRSALLDAAKMVCQLLPVEERPAIDSARGVMFRGQPTEVFTDNAGVRSER